MARKTKKSLKKERPFKKIIYLYIEGQTEKMYFNHLKKIGSIKNDISLKFKTYSKVDTFLNSFIQGEEDRILLLDIDAICDKCDPNKRKNKIIKVLNDYPKNVYFNNHSFELFLLNHKTKFTNKILKASEFVSHINKIFKVKEYKKKKEQIENICSQITCNDVKDALKNIEQMSESLFDNPSSNFNEIIDRINYI